LKQLFTILFCSLLLLGASANASAEESGLWTKTTQAVSQSADWVAEKSKNGWQHVVQFANWSSDKSKQAWNATKQGAHTTMEWSSDKFKSIHESNGRQPRAEISGHRTS